MHSPVDSASRAPGPLPYRRGLDGLRAIAVVPVLLYHALLPAWPGGFLGVDVFFVISGYLITSLLRTEHAALGRVRFAHFYIRRARRLLPALGLVMGVSVASAIAFLPDARVGLRGNVFAALTYSTNWYQVFAGQSYFEIIGRGSLLNHLWSLAVEEQFYIVWPVVLVGLLRTRAGRGPLAIALAAAAVGSAAWMRVLYDRDPSDPAAIFVRTDTRASGMLLGAALAFVWAPRAHDQPAPLPRLPRRVLDVVGAVALFALVRAYTTVNDFDAFVYRGGFLLVSLVAAVVIAVVVDPRSIWSRWLGVAPLRYLGTRSYGIYLWHWPVFLITRPISDVPFTGNANLALRLGVTLIVAEASFRWVETPIRHGAIGRVLRDQHGDRRAREQARRAFAVATAVAAVAAILLVGLFVLPVPTTAEEARSSCPPQPARLAVAIGSTAIASARAEIAARNPTLRVAALDGRTWGEVVRVAEHDLAAAPPDILVVEYPARARIDTAALDRLRASAHSVPVVVIVPGSPSQARPLRLAVHDDLNVAVAPWQNLLVAHPEWSVAETGALTTAGRAAFAEALDATITSLAGKHWAEDRPARLVGSELECSDHGLPAAVGFGDSVMDRARPGLAARMPSLLVAAAGARRFDEAIEVVRSFAVTDRLPEIVVLHLGTAAAFTDSQFAEMMALLDDVDHVVVFNMHAPKSWETIVNARLARLAPRFDNMVLVDWKRIGDAHPEWFVDDRGHLDEAGQAGYAALIDETLRGRVGPEWQATATW